MKRTGCALLLTILGGPGCQDLTGPRPSEQTAGPSQDGPKPVDFESERPEGINRWVVLGVDGMDPRVVQDMWGRGELQQLRALCDQGVCTETSSAWDSSPIIWTTVATGMTPEQHGIDRFVTETLDGRVPVGSSDRKVAALWDLSSQHHYKTALLGWWATWPSYALHGVTISARAAKDPDMPGRVWPEAMRARFDAQLQHSVAGWDETFPECGPMARNDAWVSWWTPQLLAEDYDLLLAYLRCIDGVSHPYWGYWDTEALPQLDPYDIARYEHILPANYRAVDAALARVVEALPWDTNLILLSDHGFEAVDRPQVLVRLDTDALLAHLGFAQLDSDGVAIPALSLAVTMPTSATWYRQRVRFMVEDRDQGGSLPPDQIDARRAELEARLREITYSSGRFAFRLMEPNVKEQQGGVDAVIQVLKAVPTRDLCIDDDTVEGIVGPITTSTGNHHPVAPHGFFLAWGPDIDPAFSAEAVRVQDIAPTIAYGLGLPVAEDLDGAVVESLFTPAFRAAHQQQAVASWGKRQVEAVQATAADAEQIEELQALGYLD